MPEDNSLKCSFCGKAQDQVKKLIAGPGVYICNECVDLCIDILNDEGYAVKREVHKVTLLDDIFPQSDCSFEELSSNEIAETIQTLQSLITRFKSVDRPFATEPLYRSILLLQEHKHGSSDTSLIPTLQSLFDIYMVAERFRACIQTLNWIDSIEETESQTERQPEQQAQETDSLKVDEIRARKRERMIQLARLHLKLNNSQMADSILQQLEDLQ